MAAPGAGSFASGLFFDLGVWRLRCRPSACFGDVEETTDPGNPMGYSSRNAKDDKLRYFAVL